VGVAGIGIIVGAWLLIVHAYARRSEELRRRERCLAHEVKRLEELSNEILLKHSSLREWQADLTARVARLRSVAGSIGNDEFNSWLKKEHPEEWSELSLARELVRRGKMEQELEAVRAELGEVDLGVNHEVGPR
jgi:hypothetical protein